MNAPAILLLLFFLQAPITAPAAFAAREGDGCRRSPTRLEECFAEPQAALELLARLCAPKVLGRLAERFAQEQAESVWFLRTRLIVPGCPLPDGRDMAALAHRGGNKAAVLLLEDIARCTEPKSDNYRDAELTPGGVRIRFRTCREGGGREAPVVVDISLKELEKARPRLELWRK